MTSPAPESQSFEYKRICTSELRLHTLEVEARNDAKKRETLPGSSGKALGGSGAAERLGLPQAA